MGIILTLIVLPAQIIHDRRQKKKAAKIAGNYTPGFATAEQQEQSSRRGPGDSQQPQQQSLPPLKEREEFNPTLGAARAGYPALATAISVGSTVSKAFGGIRGRQRIYWSRATRSKNRKKEEPNADTEINRSIHEATTMASDEDYAAFLERANEDPGKGYGGSKTAAVGKGGSGKVQLKAVDHGVQVPQVLQKAVDDGEWVYVSDADEPFEPVSLKIGGTTLPDEKTFATLIHHPDPHDVDIDILDVVKWDSGGQYKALVDATRQACAGGDVRVYRVPIGGTRVEYWVVGLDREGGRLVGVKALGIES